MKATNYPHSFFSAVDEDPEKQLQQSALSYVHEEEWLFHLLELDDLQVCLEEMFYQHQKDQLQKEFHLDIS